MSEDIRSIADLQRLATEIGPDTWYCKSFYGDQWVGIIEFHLHEGKVTGGYIPFRGFAHHAGYNDQWDVQSYDPLTLSPSIACRDCSHHGFIQNGRWVPA